ncbi:Thiol:disulfide interchange protein DsbD [subsurface metagenome]
MLENLLGNISQIIQTNHWLAPLAAFLGGLLTASNPCVLVMVPLMIGFITGNEQTVGIRKSLIFSGLFVLGLSITFTILGIIAALGGRLFGDVGSYWKYIVAFIALAMGVHLLGFLQFSFSIPVNTKFLGKGKLSSLALGMLFWNRICSLCRSHPGAAFDLYCCQGKQFILRRYLITFLRPGALFTHPYCRHVYGCSQNLDRVKRSPEG